MSKSFWCSRTLKTNISDMIFHLKPRQRCNGRSSTVRSRSLMFLYLSSITLVLLEAVMASLNKQKLNWTPEHHKGCQYKNVPVKNIFLFSSLNQSTIIIGKLFRRTKCVGDPSQKAQKNGEETEPATLWDVVLNSSP